MQKKSETKSTIDRLLCTLCMHASHALYACFNEKRSLVLYAQRAVALYASFCPLNTCFVCILATFFFVTVCRKSTGKKKKKHPNVSPRYQAWLHDREKHFVYFCFSETKKNKNTFLLPMLLSSFELLCFLRCCFF